jgi:DNA-binding MarR family transcriptional regulator
MGRRETTRAGGPRVTYLVGRLDRALRRRITEAVRPFGLSAAQYTTLSVLRTRGQLSNARLAQRAFISPQAMNEVVHVLLGRKLVDRKADPSHGRIVHLQLTVRGEEVLRACDTAVRRLEEDMLSALGSAQRKGFGTALLACLQSIERQRTGERAARGANLSGEVSAATV